MNKVTVVTSRDIPPLHILFAELWQYRDLILAFSVRDIKVKYFQTLFGPLWVVFTPLITVGVMTFVFGLMIKIPSDGLPYLMFYLIAIIPWLTFVYTMSNTMSSLESYATMINKIYFPRLIIGISYSINALVDFLVGYVIITLFALYFSLWNIWFVIATPFLFLIQTAWALGLGFYLAPLNAKFRDIKHAIPLFIQLYYFASPIIYPASSAPEWAKWMYLVNPLSIVITTYRNILSGTGIDWLHLAYACLVSFAVLFGGAVFFMRKEKLMADVL